MERDIHILLVDDERDFSETMGFWLKAKGYKVDIASSGEEAINMIKSKSPDIVFLDLVMPGLNGTETLRRIRDFNKDLPIIMVTAHAEEPGAIEAATQLGTAGFFPKADDFTNATRMIETALRTFKKK